MQRIDTADASGSLATPAALGTPGYFTEGDPATSTPATQVSADWLNMVQEELVAVAVADGGAALDKTNRGQVLANIRLLISAAVSAINPTGIVSHIFSSTAPAGWVVRDGGTIGDASSGATNRANADTAALFAQIWNDTSNTDFHIQDSTGSATTRGASAAADFAAHKRMPLPDDRGLFDRGLNTSGSGTDSSRVLATAQADALASHSHGLPTTSGGSAGVVGGSSLSGVGSTSTAATGGSETRPANRAYLPIIKL